jgi:hypothetical protein
MLHRLTGPLLIETRLVSARCSNGFLYNVLARMTMLRAWPMLPVSTVYFHCCRASSLETHYDLWIASVKHDIYLMPWIGRCNPVLYLLSKS